MGDLEDHLEDHIYKSSKSMNGMEIQNIFKIATQIAGKGRILQWDHIARSLDAAASFRSNIKDIYGGMDLERPSLM